MINRIIENKTPYIGKLKLKFEKHPHYTGGGFGVLNKIHINLGFTKLVSRMIPTESLDGWKIDPEKIKLIEKHTNGIIGGHWIENREPKEDFTLPNSFLTKDGRYIGDVETGWWYYKNGFKVCEDYPHGVAEVWKHYSIVGYYGYTHRGGQQFMIGDKIFDDTWVPKKEDVKSSWIEYYEQSNITLVESLDEEFLKELVNYIPFKERGSNIIENWVQCKESAIKLSKYLS